MRHQQTINGEKKMKLAWIKWADGTLTRDDGYTIYVDYRWAILKTPAGEKIKFRTAEEAKRSIE